MTNAKYFDRIAKSTPLLTAEEERELALKVRAGDKAARERMICANIKLVLLWAPKYKSEGFDVEDCLSSGMVGLIHAVDRFDPDKGYRFSTYAKTSIWREVHRSMGESKVIRIPPHARDMLYKWRQIESTATASDGTKLSDDAIAKLLSLTPNEYEWTKNALAVKRMTKVISESMSANGRGHLADMAESREPCPVEVAADAEEMDRVKSAVAKLPKAYAKVMRARFGLTGKKALTHREIGKRDGKSHQGIQQIEARAIKRLRAQLVT